MVRNNILLFKRVLLYCLFVFYLELFTMPTQFKSFLTTFLRIINMKNVIIVLIVATTLSCVKEVDLTIRKESNRPVLNCIFNPDSVFRVYLTESNSHELLYPATVKLLKTDFILETLEYSTDNFF